MKCPSQSHTTGTEPDFSSWAFWTFRLLRQLRSLSGPPSFCLSGLLEAHHMTKRGKGSHSPSALKSRGASSKRMSRSPPVQSELPELFVLREVLVLPGSPPRVPSSHRWKCCLRTPQGILAQRSRSTLPASPHRLADFQAVPMLGPVLEGTNLIYTI